MNEKTVDAHSVETPDTLTSADDASATAQKSPRMAALMRRPKIIIAIIVAVVIVIAAAIAVPLIIQSQQHAAAVSASEKAQADFTQALSSMQSAEKDLEAAQYAASDAWSSAQKLVDVAGSAPTLFNPSTSIDDLKAKVDALAAAAGLSLNQDLKIEIAFTDAQNDAKASLESSDSNIVVPSKDASTERLLDVAKSRNDLVTKFTAISAALTASKSSIDDAVTALKAPTLAVMEAGHAYGSAWARPEKSTDSTWAAYQQAVANIASDKLTDDSDLPSLAQAYIDTQAAAQKSHDDTVAAEQAAQAEEARRALEAQQSTNSRRSSSGSSGSSNSGSSGSSNSSGSSGGSGGSGGQIIIPGGGGGADYCNQPGYNCAG